MKLKALALAAAAAAGEIQDLRYDRHCDAAVSGVGAVVLRRLAHGEKADCAAALKRSCSAAAKKLPPPADSDERQISDHRFTLAELAVSMVAQHRSLGDRCIPEIASLDTEAKSACAESAAFAAGFVPADRYLLAALVVTGQADRHALEARIGPEDGKMLRSDVRRFERMPASVVERVRMIFARCPYASSSKLTTASR